MDLDVEPGQGVAVEVDDVDLLLGAGAVAVADGVVDRDRDTLDQLGGLRYLALQLRFQARVDRVVGSEQVRLGADQVDQRVAVIQQDGALQRSDFNISRLRRPSVCSFPGVSRMKGSSPVTGCCSSNAKASFPSIPSPMCQWRSALPPART